MQGSCFVSTSGLQHCPIFPCPQASKHAHSLPETQTQPEISTRGSPCTSRCATMQVSRLPLCLNDASRWSLSSGGGEVARCSLAPQAVSAARSTAGNKGLGTNHHHLDLRSAVNIRWRHQAVTKSAVHSREQILFNLPARPKGPEAFSFTDNPSQLPGAIPQKPTEYSPIHGFGPSRIFLF